MNKFIKQNGYSLMELLASIAIGALVMTSAVVLQVSNRGQFEDTSAELEMRTNAKMATEFIGTSIRGVGVMGCRTIDGYEGGKSDTGKNIAAYNVSLNTTTLAYADFNKGHEIQGYEAVGTSWTPVPSATLNLLNMEAGSDAITLRGGIGESYVLVERQPGDLQYTLSIPGGTDVRIAENNFAVASTCKNAEVFKVTSTDAQIDSGNILRAAGTQADDNRFGSWTPEQGISRADYGELRRVATVSYFVANNPINVPTLYRSVDGETTPSPLVEGVERLVLEYGIEDEKEVRNSAARYLTADAIQATCSTPLSVPVSANCLWPHVVSVRVGVVMRTREEVYNADVAKTITIPGASNVAYNVNDKYARTVYTTQYAIRNRLIGERK